MTKQDEVKWTRQQVDAARSIVGALSNDDVGDDDSPAMSMLCAEIAKHAHLWTEPDGCFWRTMIDSVNAERDAALAELAKVKEQLNSAQASREMADDLHGEAVEAAVLREREACAKIADNHMRYESGFRQLAMQSRDAQRASDFKEGEIVADSISATIRSRTPEKPKAEAGTLEPKAGAAWACLDCGASGEGNSRHLCMKGSQAKPSPSDLPQKSTQSLCAWCCTLFDASDEKLVLYHRYDCADSMGARSNAERAPSLFRKDPPAPRTCWRCKMPIEAGSMLVGDDNQRDGERVAHLACEAKARPVLAPHPEPMTEARIEELVREGCKPLMLWVRRFSDRLLKLEQDVIGDNANARLSALERKQDAPAIMCWRCSKKIASNEQYTRDDGGLCHQTCLAANAVPWKPAAPASDLPEREALAKRFYDKFTSDHGGPFETTMYRPGWLRVADLALSMLKERKGKRVTAEWLWAEARRCGLNKSRFSWDERNTVAGHYEIPLGAEKQYENMAASINREVGLT